MTKICDIFSYFEELVPSNLKMDFDNVGLLVGESDATVTKVLTALDITFEVIREAQVLGAQLIVSHHPLIFSGMKRISDADATGRKIMTLIKSGISAICLHTNLDCVAEGVSDALMDVLGAECVGVLEEFGIAPDGQLYGAGRVGVMPREFSLKEFLRHTAQAIDTEGLRYSDAGKPVRRIAVCGGSGGEYMETAVRFGCDTFVTADIKHDRFITASELGINLIDGGHFATENVIVPRIADKLREKFPNLEITVSEKNADPASFYPNTRIMG